MLVLGLALAAPVVRADEAGWYLKPYGGLSQLSDTKGDRVDGTAQWADVSVDPGFLAGLGFGYRYNARWAAEVAWEYRTNDSETRLADGTVFDDGNYASNVFFLNGYYYLSPRGKWQPYLGAGLGWVQEIDIDLEGAGPEQSFAGDGDVMLQVFAGVDYAFNDRLSMNLELRYARLSGVDLDAESGPAGGSIEDLDYDPVSLAAGITYRF